MLSCKYLHFVDVYGEKKTPTTPGLH